MKNELAGVGGAVAGAAVGAGLGYLGQKGLQKGFTALNSSKAKDAIGNLFGSNAAQNHELYRKFRTMKAYADVPIRFLFSPEYKKARALTGAAVGAAKFAPMGRDAAKAISNVSTLNKQYVDQFGVAPTEDEYFDVAKLDPDNKNHRMLMNLFYTPNAMTKSNYRAIQRNRGLDDIPPEENRGYLKKGMYKGGITDQMMYNRPTMKSKKQASSDDNEDVEKVAVDVRAAGNMIKDVYRGAVKYTPKATTALGVMASIPVGSNVADALVEPDDDHAKLKRGAIMAGSALTGGMLGNRMGHDAVDIPEGVKEKIKNPKKLFGDAANKAKKMFNFQ